MNKITESVLENIQEYIIPQMIEDGFDNDAQIIAAYQTLILSAKHYSLPDGGRLMEITGFNASVPGSATTGSAIRSDSTATGLVTDLSSATAATINQLRQAFQLQKLYERDARGGTRYVDRKSTRLNSSHITRSRMPSSA